MQKSVPVFWSRWIMVISFFLIAYGLAMVFAPQMMRTPVAAILFDNNESFRRAFVAAGEPESTFLHVLSGLLGTVTTGWAIQTAWIAHKPFRCGETWAWNALAMSISAWSALEFYYKLVESINGIGLFAHFGLWIAFAVPLLATYRYFHPTFMTNQQEDTHDTGIPV
ncbi:hypothetical protein FBR01_17880 [Anaerolineae bacterium CFX8]|nr:hypothetical protein [Anaerolineae bacterium CFX8]